MRIFELDKNSLERNYTFKRVEEIDKYFKEHFSYINDHIDYFHDNTPEDLKDKEKVDQFVTPLAIELSNKMKKLKSNFFPVTGTDVLAASDDAEGYIDDMYILVHNSLFNIDFKPILTKCLLRNYEFVNEIDLPAYSVGSLSLEKFGNWGNAQQVSGSYITNKYRGKGIMLNMYATLILRKNITLVSDMSQSEGAMRMWKELSKVRGIAVYGYNSRSDEVFNVFTTDDDDVEDSFDSDQGFSHGGPYFSLQREITKLSKKIVQAQVSAAKGKISYEKSNKLVDELTKQQDELEQEKEEYLSASGTMVLVATKGTTSKDPDTKYRLLKKRA